jgi:CBS domain-containing protein
MAMAEQTLSDVMLTKPKTLPADVTVADARRALGSASVEMLLLVDGERFSGAVTAIPDDAAPEEPALRYRDESPPSATAGTPVPEALALLDERAHGRIVVLDGERLAGLVCLTADGERFCGTPGAMS